MTRNHTVVSINSVKLVSQRNPLRPVSLRSQTKLNFIALEDDSVCIENTNTAQNI